MEITLGQLTADHIGPYTQIYAIAVVDGYDTVAEVGPTLMVPFVARDTPASIIRELYIRVASLDEPTLQAVRARVVELRAKAVRT